MTDPHVSHHGVTKARGCAHVAVGKFSRLFPDLDNLVITEDEAAAIGGPGGVMHDFDDSSPDGDVPAGYIFFAQFIDHDITLDTTSPLRPDTPLTAKEVGKLGNLRSASLDLDAVYGFGPEGSPHLYDAANPHCLAVHPNGRDLARSPSGTALIGDPRNDENIFLAQLHLVFHLLHNRIYFERVRQTDITDRTWSRFEAAQQETRYHYQWVVLFDFLKRICDPKIYAFAVTKLCDPDENFPLCYGPQKHNKQPEKNGKMPEEKGELVEEHGELPMPVEFSTAAFRVGHAMVRNRYAINGGAKDVELFDTRFGTQGFTALPEELVIDWRFMLEMTPHVQPRMSKAFNPLLADDLQNLPIVPSKNPNNRALAFRNLMRASALGVPSGQAVAKELKAKGYPLEVQDLKLDTLKSWKRVENVLHKSGKDLATETPLFFYLLRESELVSGGRRYGPVGSALLLEVFGGMLRFCENSIISNPKWRPDRCIASDHDEIDMKKLIEDPDYNPLQLRDLVHFAQRTALS